MNTKKFQSYFGLTNVTGHIVQHIKKRRTGGFGSRGCSATSGVDTEGAEEVLLLSYEVVSDAARSEELTVRLTVLLRGGTATGMVSSRSIERGLGTYYCQQCFLQYSPVQPGV